MRSSSSAMLFFTSRRVQLSHLRRVTLPTIYAERDFAEIGGLMSYGAESTDAIVRSAFMLAAFSKARSL